MTADPVPEVDVGLPEITQIAFVVEDLEDAMRRFGSVLGVEPWLVYDYEPPRLSDTTYRGESHEYSMRVALSDVEGPIDLQSTVLPAGVLERSLGWVTSLRDRIGALLFGGDETWSASLPNPGLPGVNVELIEPVTGPSIYTDHLDAHGEGLHHVGCFAYDDPYAVRNAFADAGVEVVQSGTFDGLEFWYLDMTDELNGLVLEIAANVAAVPDPDAVVSP